MSHQPIPRDYICFRCRRLVEFIKPRQIVCAKNRNTHARRNKCSQFRDKTK